METPKIFAAMVAISRDLGAIGKNKRNQQQGFMYRGIDDVYNAMHEIMPRHGVFCTPRILEKTREERTNAKGTVLAFTTLRIEYVFYADDGSHVSCIVEGEGMDSGDKSSNKAMSIAHKYALLQTFCVATEELQKDDPDKESHEVKPAPKMDTNALRQRLERAADEGLDALRKAWESLSTAEKAAISPKGCPRDLKDRAQQATAEPA